MTSNMRKIRIASFAVVMNLNQTGLGIVRNLSADLSLEIIGFYKELNHAAASRFISRSEKLSLETDESAILEWLIHEGQRSRAKGFIFPTSETEIAFLIRHREALSRYYTLSIPNENIVDKILDKYVFFTVLQEHGFRTPKTILIDSSSSVSKALSGELYPAVLKPAFSGDWKTGRASEYIGPQKAVLVSGSDELSEKYDRLSVLNPRLILQKVVPSEENDTYSFCCYADRDGNVLWGAVTQKLVQYPPGFGTAIVSRVVHAPDIFNLGKMLVKSIGLDGIAEVEIMRESGTGSLYVIEINTRHWQQHVIATRMGMNISLMDYYYRTGNQVKVNEILKNQRPDIRKEVWIDDVGYLIHCIKSRFRTSDCRFSDISFRNAVFSVFSTKDPGPFFRLLKEKGLPRKAAVKPARPDFESPL